MKIAVIGAGISGLGSAVILSQEHEVHLFEAEHRLGGHAHTYTASEGASSLPMDVGFLVFNDLTYPHLIAFFEYLDVKTNDSDMSLSIRSLQDELEWSGTNMNSVFGQRRNLIRPRFYLMLLEILRFHREAESNLQLSRRHGWSLRDLFSARNFSRDLSQKYVLPMGAAIWSTPEFGMLDYPADTFLTFFLNHKLLQVNDRPVWKTVTGGSVNYVQKAKALIPHIHSGEPVTAVKQVGEKILVETNHGEDTFDRVVMATHAPTTSTLLKDLTLQEKEILSAFKTEPNQAILHHDLNCMPQSKRCWSSWNVTAGVEGKVSLTYHLNRLQQINSQRHYLLTLNPTIAPNEQLMKFSFHHPLFTRDTIRAQKNLDSIQGNRGIYYCGAWTRYGFHEDGLLSAVKVAEKIGVTPPWEIKWKAA